VEHANQTLSPIFDKEKEQNRLKEAQLIGEIGSQVSDIVRTQGDINGLKAAKEKLGPLKENATEKERAAYMDTLRNSDVYKAEMAKYGTGSAIQQGLQAATAAIQGLAGGDLAKAIAGASAPYLAEIIKQTAPDETSRVMAHAVVAGALAAVQGNSAAAGAAGAVTTALMGEAIKNALYGDTPVSELSESQKQTLVALGTVAAGLAGGLMGDSSANAMAGAQAGQNEISNNMMSIGVLEQMMAHSIMNSAAMAEAGSQDPDDQAALALTKAAKQGLSAACLANTSCVMMAIINAQNQPKAPSNTGGDQITEQSPTDTGGNQQVDSNITHTGNNQPSEQGSTDTGNTNGVRDVGGNTTTTPIAEQNPDDLAYLALKGKEAQEAAKNLGFGQRIPPQKAPFDSHGQPVYSNGKNYITPDVDSHNVTNGWKMFNSKGKRIGTYDSELNRIKD
ncbi:VENN motif pre-toxin domain-containing protein, partial [Edaphovirga cremea]|uniref:VENN motif pre-toxin domain-containing protein n=1 Tax=Edaphovirga cremea TaxID=2267246 RepID=UPI003988E0D8